MTRVLLSLLVLSCSPRIVRVPTAAPVQQVAIVSLPDIGSCYLPDLPETPEQLIVTSQQEPDVMRRMYIHRREFEDLLEHLRWWRHWAEYMQDCIKDRMNLP